MNTNQIDAWKSEFGDAYHARNPNVETGVNSIERRMLLWANVLSNMPQQMSILEVGAGMGANLYAIRNLRPDWSLYALEPNEKAFASLDFWHIRGTAEAIEAVDPFDLVFTYGVLIHLLDPLPAMREIYRVSRRFVMSVEYFSPSFEDRTQFYRGGELGVPLIRNDYGSLWMDNFDVKPISYGFAWHRVTGLDNVTWWLFEKPATDQG